MEAASLGSPSQNRRRYKHKANKRLLQSPNRARGASGTNVRRDPPPEQQNGAYSGQSDADEGNRPAPLRDETVLTRPKPRLREHLRSVTRQACLICGRTPSDAHHYLQPRALGLKSVTSSPSHSAARTIGLCIGSAKSGLAFSICNNNLNRRKLSDGVATSVNFEKLRL